MAQFLIFLVVIAFGIVAFEAVFEPILDRREEARKLAKYLRERRKEDLRIWRESSRVPLP